MTNRFYAPKGRHKVIKLTVLSVLGVHIICGVYLLYYLRQECQNSCLNAFRVMERHAPLPLPSDLEKSCPRAYILGIPNLISEHSRITESVHIQLSDHCDLDFLALVLRKMCCLVLSNDFP